MRSCKAQYRLYDADGRLVGAGDIYLPGYLDWMSIDVKAHWFRYMGQGVDAAKFALLMSQGEQRLLIDVTLTPLDYKAYKEKEDGASAEIDRFIEEGGHSRIPRNQ